jgi:hypothetical protein
VLNLIGLGKGWKREEMQWMFFYFYDWKTCIKEKRDEIDNCTERNYACDPSHIMM